MGERRLFGFQRQLCQYALRDGKDVSYIYQIYIPSLTLDKIDSGLPPGKDQSLLKGMKSIYTEKM